MTPAASTTGDFNLRLGADAHPDSPAVSQHVRPFGSMRTPGHVDFRQDSGVRPPLTDEPRGYSCWPVGSVPLHLKGVDGAKVWDREGLPLDYERAALLKSKKHLKRSKEQQEVQEFRARGLEALPLKLYRQGGSGLIGSRKRGRWLRAFGAL